MKTILKIVKKSIAGFMLLAFAVGPFGSLPSELAHAATTWDTTGTYVLSLNYLGSEYQHDMSLVQDVSDNLTGNGGGTAGGNIYTWVITSGSVADNTIDFLADYTATPDAVTPQTTMHIVGVIAGNGTISGTWSDNYQGAERAGTFSTLSGAATSDPISGNVITNPATSISQTDATLNGTNGNNYAIGHSFWASLNTFSTASPSLPAGVYSTTNLGTIDANTAFSALLSSTGITVTPNTTYYFTAWSNVNGVWYPGQVLNFTTTALVPITSIVDLGTAGNYVILAKTGISTTGPTNVVGNMGVSPSEATSITGFALNLVSGSSFSTSALVTGKIYAPGYAAPTPTNLTTAVSNMETAYTTANGLAAGTTELGSGNIGGMTIVPGVYKWTTGVTIPANVTLSGGVDDVWVFQIAQNLNISSAVHVLLSGGAQANNIFWVVAGQTTIGTTAVFNGNILDKTAIVINTGATLNGRALAQTAVTLDSNYVSNNFTAETLSGTLSAEDFGVVNYDTGLGMLKGYTAGFGLTDATLAGATSVVVKLYSGNTLLQTNTAILPKFNADITGIQFSSPFDVSGTFNYATDGYWTNLREAQYGQSIPATKVVAIVELANGKFVSAENNLLTGDPVTIYPISANITTNPATAINPTDATLNGTNGINNAIGHSFWASLNTFSTASSALPAGVYSTTNLGTITASTPFSALLSSTGITVTPNTTYYFAAWSNVDGTWYPGEILNFTTGTTTGGIGGEVVPSNGILAVTSIEMTDVTSIANNSFEDGWEYVFNITVPTNETNLSMKFADWVRTGGSEIIPAANNMRISSAQANNGGATVPITAANTYSTPVLTMTTDLNPALDGIQVKVTVEVKIPVGTTNGNYTTNYGVKSQ